MREKQEKWLKFNHMEATVMEALDMLNELVRGGSSRGERGGTGTRTQ